MEGLHHYWIEKGIPDPADTSLSARCGGDLRSSVFKSMEQILRIVSGMPPRSVRIGIYFVYNPSLRRECRTQVHLLGKCLNESDPESSESLRLLLGAGPLQTIYGSTLKDVSQDEKGDKNPLEFMNLEAYHACYRIQKRAEFCKVRPEMRKGNHRLQGFLNYFAVHPFVARAENDWLGIDRLLDQMEHPGMIEITVGPFQAESLVNDQFRYGYLLSQINALDSPLDRNLAEESRRRILERLQQDPAADRFNKLNQELGELLQQPQLLFTVRCWSASRHEGRLLTSVLCEDCFQEGSYSIQNLISVDGSLARAREAARQMVVIPFSIGEIVEDKDAFPSLWQLNTVATAEELIGVFRLPVGKAATVPRTMYLHTDPPPAKTGTWTDGGPTGDSSLFIGEDLEVGPITLDKKKLSSTTDLSELFREPDSERAEIRLERSLLQKHLFVCGVPGSGKTTAMFNFVAQLYFHGTPFLIIEPAKTEYRMFKKFRRHPDPRIRQLAQDLRVYTIGEERVSPLRFNPMLRGAGVSIEEHIGALMACFKASMPIEGPLEGILLESLHYLFYDSNQDVPPRIADLLDVALTVLKNKGYDSEISGNLRAALEVRLGFLTKGSLGQVFDCYENSPGLKQLFESPVVLEMDLLTQENACLMTLFVLTALRQHLRLTSRSGSTLRHVVFLEEAHNIVGRTGGDETTANPKKFAAEYIARMLAEVRALGEGMIIADQLPSAVAPEVIKNTGSKLALRLVANDDREELGGTMLLDETRVEELARLPVGCGFFYREKYYRPRRVQTLNTHALLSATLDFRTDETGKSVAVLEEFEPPTRQELERLIVKDSWNCQGILERCALQSVNQIRLNTRFLTDTSEQLESAVNRGIRFLVENFGTGTSEEAKLVYNDLKEWIKVCSQEALESAKLSRQVLKYYAPVPMRESILNLLLCALDTMTNSGLISMRILSLKADIVVAGLNAILSPEDDGCEIELVSPDFDGDTEIGLASVNEGCIEKSLDWHLERSAYYRKMLLDRAESAHWQRAFENDPEVPDELTLETLEEFQGEYQGTCERTLQYILDGTNDLCVVARASGHLSRKVNPIMRVQSNHASDFEAQVEMLDKEFQRKKDAIMVHLQFLKQSLPRLWALKDCSRELRNTINH